MSNNTKLRTNDTKTSQSSKHPLAGKILTSDSKSLAGLAVYIVGCLAAQGVIVLDLAKPDWIEHFDQAVRMVHACLKLQPDPLEMLVQPLDLIDYDAIMHGDNYLGAIASYKARLGDDNRSEEG